MKSIYLLAFILGLSSFYSYGAKKHCAELLTKVHNIQSQQRQGATYKKSIQLRKKEDIARDKWWACENNTNKPQKNVKRKKKKVSKSLRSKPNKNITPVFSSNNIVIKSKFSGSKQLQWLNFYKRPKECLRPKTTQVFAYCMEEKAAQQNKFEQQY